jgi:ATP-dependent DNA helicase RecG
MELSFATPIQYVPRVGPAMSKRLEKLEIRTVGDLIEYPPFRYNDFSLVSNISQVQPEEIVTISGKVKSITTIITKNGKRMQLCSIYDNTGTIQIIWFNQPYLLSIIKPEMFLHVSGKVSWFGRKLSIISPDYEIAINDSKDESLHTGRLVPIYSETEGISSKWLRGRIAYLLKLGLQNVPDFMPSQILYKYRLPSRSDAISSMHFPQTKNEAVNARRRLAFEEIFLLVLQSLMLKRNWETTQKAYSVKQKQTDYKKFMSGLPFKLTSDQTQAISEILSDIERPFPMNRLLEGDVGSGKTVVAAFAMYAAHQMGLQSIIMAPTQILAEQHYKTLTELLLPFKIPVELVTGNKTIRNGPLYDKSAVIVGTHALLSEKVTFENVGLIVIDEQQRFGVAQRTLLREKGSGINTPHLLTMTATPIPRTIALAIYGNLDLSIMREMPIGRKPVKTWVVPQEKRESAYDWMKKQMANGPSQIFVICPLIEDSESLSDVKAVTSEFDRLKRDIFPKLPIGLLHGRLKPKEKSQILEEFHSGTTRILVTTPVVEVGIDIPEASIILIEAADRFGLAQLHQLRGRVGRRNQDAYCLLFTDSSEERVINRLKHLERIHNGPSLAETDLQIRGPGELFGTKQHGLPHLKYANILDLPLMQEARTAVLDLINNSPNLTEFPLLREKVANSTISLTNQD